MIKNITFILLALKLCLEVCGKETYPLYGNVTTLRYYFAEIYVGSPPQKQSMLIDTGSSLVALPCEEYCKGNCGKQHRDPFFNPEVSRTFTQTSCNSEEMERCECENGKCVYTTVKFAISKKHRYMVMAVATWECM
eukprot:TRINITY_DN4418_c0_g1_i1.p5 TRINITY_DN4418_c0_g1~~TRINITY_DN4418_c0_g1_i1.p5  ORF type:complete len:136 (-),score=6.56 TRINITY_DN4418_c0_g1_i1:1198-1605(-)